MNKILNTLLQKFNSLEQLEQHQAYARQVQAMTKTPRSATYKPAFSMGYRGFPRTMNKLGSTPAPTIDQVRKLERAYMCKLVVKRGLIYFRDGTAFTHERGKAYRISVMDEVITSIHNPFEGLTINEHGWISKLDKTGG